MRTDRGGLPPGCPGCGCYEPGHYGWCTPSLIAEGVAVVEGYRPAAIEVTTIRRVARPRGELSAATLRRLEKSKDRAQDAEILYRRAVLDALVEGSFSAVSEATGLSTNTLQRWKREAGK